MTIRPVSERIVDLAAVHVGLTQKAQKRPKRLQLLANIHPSFLQWRCNPQRGACNATRHIAAWKSRLAGDNRIA
jgi:hypothetical protein